MIVDTLNEAIPPLTADEAASIATVDLTTALTIQLTTKADLWSMNHHTGQSAIAVAGYVAKVLRAKFSTDVTQQMTSMAHTIDH